MIHILQDLIQDEAYSNFDIAVLCFVVADVYGINKRAGYISGASIAAQMNNGGCTSARQRSKVERSIEYLIENGAITGIQYDKHLYKIEMSSFDIKDRFYRSIELDDLYAIMQQSYQPFDVLRQYLLILCSININTKYGTWGLNQFADVIHKDTKTISKYITVLEEMRLIYVYREGGMGHVSNTYGKYVDAKIVEAAGKERSKHDGNITKSNYKRRMKQMYNQVAKGKKYDDATMRELQDYFNLTFISV